MNPLIQPKKITHLFVVLFGFACFALLQMARAVTPAPDGGYPGRNTAEGDRALLSLTSGSFNTAVGYLSLRSVATGSFNTAVGGGTLFANTGDQNTATGLGALFSNVTASGNTADGAFALFSNSTGVGNTATGLQALFSNADGIRNTANGVYALNHNVSGGGNTAVGYQALANNTADSNTATGNDALVFNTAGAQNTANGNAALANNTAGNANTAVGFNALTSNTTGATNTAVGSGALASNTVGFSNTAVGANALSSNTTAVANTAIGTGALVNNISGDGNNIALGFNAGTSVTTASNVICIGALGQDVNHSCYIGQIFGAAANGGSAVFINPDGQLGTSPSSRQFKQQIKPMDRSSEALLALRPVTFRYKKEIDPTGTSQFGLVAEDVEKVNPDLVVRDKKGKPYSVRYDQVNAMLLNEFLKGHCKVEEQAREIREQKATISELKKGMETVVAHLKEQDSKIQQVNDQLELTKPVPQVVNNSQ